VCRWQAQLDGTDVETLLQLVQLGFTLVGAVVALVRRRVSDVGVGVSPAGDVVSPVGDEVAPLGRPGRLIKLFVVTHPGPLLTRSDRRVGQQLISAPDIVETLVDGMDHDVALVAVQCLSITIEVGDQLASGSIPHPTYSSPPRHPT
jgi:hypothetical protein